MDEILKRLLNELEAIGEEHEEIYDSEVREQMSNAIFDGFIRPKDGFALLDELGMRSPIANQEVRAALANYIAAANAEAARAGVSSFHDRLAAFQNSEIDSDGEGAFYDDFFGYSRPDAFDALGDVLEAS